MPSLLSITVIDIPVFRRAIAASLYSNHLDLIVFVMYIVVRQITSEQSVAIIVEANSRRKNRKAAYDIIRCIKI